MRLTINQHNLSKSLGIVSRAVSSRTTMPVLSNILLATDGDDRLKLSATNREIAITCWIGARVEDDGAITIPAKLLTEFVNSLPDAQIEMDLAVRTQTLGLKCGKFTANIKGIDANEFPLIEPMPDDVGATAFVPHQLSATIDRVTFAASVDENRPTLTGVNMASTVEGLTMAATDGFRLSVVTHDTDVEFSSIIMPATTLNEIARIAVDLEEVRMWIGDRAFFALDGNAKAAWQRVEVVSELIDARFPDYNATVPKNAETTVTVSAAELLKAARVALLFARDNANIVKLTAADEALQLSATSPEMGDNVSDLPARVNGPEIAIAFNAKLLIDALVQFSGDVVIELTSPTRPGLLYAPGKRDEFYHVIMPMHPPRG